MHRCSKSPACCRSTCGQPATSENSLPQLQLLARLTACSELLPFTAHSHKLHCSQSGGPLLQRSPAEWVSTARQMPHQPRQPLPTPPRRYPFLLVDRVLEWEYGKYAVGYKCVTVSALLHASCFGATSRSSCASLSGQQVLHSGGGSSIVGQVSLLRLASSMCLCHPHPSSCLLKRLPLPSASPSCPRRSTTTSSPATSHSAPSCPVREAACDRPAASSLLELSPPATATSTLLRDCSPHCPSPSAHLVHATSPFLSPFPQACCRLRPWRSWAASS